MLETLYRLLSLYGNRFLDVLKINLYFSLCVCVCQVCVKRAGVRTPEVCKSSKVGAGD